MLHAVEVQPSLFLFLGVGGVFNRLSFWHLRRGFPILDDVGSGDGLKFGVSPALDMIGTKYFIQSAMMIWFLLLISKINTHPKMDAAPIHTCKHRYIYIPLVIVCICSQWFIPSALKSCFIQHWADFMLLYMMPAWRFTSCSSEMACLKNLQFPRFSRLQSKKHGWFTL